MSANLEGQRVALTVSEPWDFGTEVGVGPHLGTIVADCLTVGDKPGEVVVEMDDQLTFRGSSYSLLRAVSRRVSVGLERLLAGDRVFCNLVAVSGRTGPTTASQGGGAWLQDETSSGLIGTLELLAPS
jgi:hypothetical protein